MKSKRLKNFRQLKKWQLLVCQVKELISVRPSSLDSKRSFRPWRLDFVLDDIGNSFIGFRSLWRVPVVPIEFAYIGYRRHCRFGNGHKFDPYNFDQGFYRLRDMIHFFLLKLKLRLWALGKTSVEYLENAVRIGRRQLRRERVYIQRTQF